MTSRSERAPRPGTAPIPLPERPRERLLRRGPEGLADDELVAVLLGTGAPATTARAVAARLLDEAGGVRGLGRVGGGLLAACPGVGAAKAARLLAAIELGRRVIARPLDPGRPLASSRDVAAAFRPRLADAAEERFLVVALDARNRPIREEEVARGSAAACPVSPAAVFRRLIAEAAVAAVFVHNHPSGDPSPSPEDVAFTERLVQAGALLDVAVLDHVIVARGGHFSFLDEGLLAPAAGAPRAA